MKHRTAKTAYRAVLLAQPLGGRIAGLPCWSIGGDALRPNIYAAAKTCPLAGLQAARE